MCESESEDEGEGEGEGKGESCVHSEEYEAFEFVNFGLDDGEVYPNF